MADSASVYWATTTASASITHTEHTVNGVRINAAYDKTTTVVRHNYRTPYRQMAKLCYYAVFRHKNSCD